MAALDQHVDVPVESEASCEPVPLPEPLPKHRYPWPIVAARTRRRSPAQVEVARGSGPVLLLARGFAGVITCANALRIVWFDAVYAVGVSLALPAMLGAF